MSLDARENDLKVFVTNNSYNCPFCGRRNVVFSIVGELEYHPTANDVAYVWVVKCSEPICKKNSLHITSYELKASAYKQDGLNVGWVSKPEITGKDGLPVESYDDAFYYHHPQSGFAVDVRIPGKIRSAIVEADSCRTQNFLIGGSACLRKAIYLVLKDKEISEFQEENPEVFEDMNTRLDKLRKKMPDLKPEIGHLKSVHKLTSAQVHENDNDSFSALELKYLIEVVHDMLFKVYVVPQEEQKRAKKLSEMQRNLSSRHKATKNAELPESAATEDLT